MQSTPWRPPPHPMGMPHVMTADQVRASMDLPHRPPQPLTAVGVFWAVFLAIACNALLGVMIAVLMQGG